MVLLVTAVLVLEILYTLKFVDVVQRLILVSAFLFLTKQKKNITNKHEPKYFKIMKFK